MIKLKAIGKVCRLFTVIWIQMMAIPVEMLNLIPFRNGCFTHPHTLTHTHVHVHKSILSDLIVHMCTVHTDTLGLHP